LTVNKIAQKYEKEILFITPVANDVYLKKIEFTQIAPFFEALLRGGVREVKLFYSIPSMSYLRDKEGRYIAFMDDKHLNSYFVEKWLKDYILKDTIYDIIDLPSLKTYIQEIEAYRERLKVK